MKLMNVSNGEVMQKIENLYENYGVRAKALQKEGEQVIGYVCSFVPLEIITAAGCVPFRIRGDIHEPITKGDTLLETIVCPFIRSCFDMAVKGKYDFLSGIAIPHGCDSMTRSYSTWSYSLDLPYSHFINIPSVVKEHSFEFFGEEIKSFRTSLERFMDKDITDDDLNKAIQSHNAYRDKVSNLYNFRKSDPPLVSGVEAMKILTVGSSLPIEEANQLMDDAIEEIGKREEAHLTKGSRVLVDSACIDNFELVKIIEDSGAHVVVDTICNGTRDHFPKVQTDGSPIDALAHRYLYGINCPKTYRSNETGSFEKDAASRFGDIGKFAKEFKVDGAVLYVYRYCDPFGFEVPARKAYYESIHVPMLYLEDQYSTGTIGQLKTRIQAFLEMIG
jgi:benzoyl-CoA reductase subunit C